jgi:biopolymer transport protein ExbD
MLKIKGRSRSTPTLSTASLPDIVFILLFFFMVATHIRTENTPNNLPKVDFAMDAKPLPSLKLAVNPKIPGYYFLNDQPLTLEELHDKLDKSTSAPTTVQVFLDKKLAMKEVGELKQMLAGWKMTKIQYMVFD